MQIREFQNFPDKVSAMSISQDDQAFLRPVDKLDLVQIESVEYQILHYQVFEKFRIHGYLDGELFVVYRLAPHHTVHKG